MNNSVLLLLSAIILVPIFSAVVFSLVIFRRNRRGRRSPLTGNLLRGPGETLREGIEQVSEKMDNAIFIVFGTCLPPMSFVILLSHLQYNKVPVWQLVVTYLFFILLVFWANRRLFRLLQLQANLYLGLDAELAVGQELNHLMLQGCRVFHDFPAEGFNIDHVVIGREGVFAVETKGRPKPDKGGGAQDARVTFDGKNLQFPGWNETEPLNQAKRQAVWLSKWLSSAVGESVIVQPVLALPGWFVDLRARTEFLVFNGKNPQLILRRQQRELLDDAMLQRIVHQVEQRCRNVAPVAYSRKWKKAKTGNL